MMLNINFFKIFLSIHHYQQYDDHHNNQDHIQDHNHYHQQYHKDLNIIILTIHHHDHEKVDASALLSPTSDTSNGSLTLLSAAHCIIPSINGQFLHQDFMDTVFNKIYFTLSAIYLVRPALVATCKSA